MNLFECLNQHFLVLIVILPCNIDKSEQLMLFIVKTFQVNPIVDELTRNFQLEVLISQPLIFLRYSNQSASAELHSELQHSLYQFGKCFLRSSMDRHNERLSLL